MVSAINTVEKKDMTIYSAAARYSVPHKMLDDRIKGHVRRSTYPGPRTIFTSEEECGVWSHLQHSCIIAQ